MNKREVVKFAAKTVVQTVAGSTITKALLRTIPATEQYKIAEITGIVGGWYVGEKLEPQTDLLVDNYFNQREKKTLNALP